PEPTLLRLRRGELGEGPEPGAERGCAAALRAHPGAHEVARRLLPPEVHPSLPRALAQRLEPLAGGRGVRVVRRARVVEAARARAALALAQSLELAAGPYGDALAWGRRRALGARLRIEAELLYGDVALGARDQARVALARAAERRHAARALAE